MKELFPEKTDVSTSVKVIGSSQKRVMRKFTSNGKTCVASTSSKPTMRQSVSPPAVATGSTDAVSKGKGRAAFVTKTNPGNRKGTVSSKVIVGVKESSAVTTSLKRTESRFAPPSVASGAPGAVSEMNSRAIRVSKSKDALKATDPTPKNFKNSAAQVAIQDTSKVDKIAASTSTCEKGNGRRMKRIKITGAVKGNKSDASTSSKRTKRQSVPPPAVATGSTEAVSKEKGRTVFSKVMVGVEESSAVTTSFKRTKARFAPLSAASGAPGAVLEMNSCAIDVSKSKDRNNIVPGGMKRKIYCCHICEVYSCFCLMISKLTII